MLCGGTAFVCELLSFIHETAWKHKFHMPKA